MKIKHNHFWVILWNPWCPRCEVNQILHQCDKEMAEFYFHNSTLLTHWEKEYLKERYCR